MSWGKARIAKHLSSVHHIDMSEDIVGAVLRKRQRRLACDAKRASMVDGQCTEHDLGSQDKIYERAVHDTLAEHQPLGQLHDDGSMETQNDGASAL